MCASAVAAWDGDPAALNTLYGAGDCEQLLAPSTPFIAEEMYQNLVAGVDPQTDDSVHLSLAPVQR